jgi:hypothetical protein
MLAWGVRGEGGGRREEGEEGRRRKEEGGRRKEGERKGEEGGMKNEKKYHEVIHGRLDRVFHGGHHTQKGNPVTAALLFNCS